MRNKKLIIVLVLTILAVAMVLLSRSLLQKESNPENNVVTTGQVARAVALLENTSEECQTVENRFKKDKNWYVPFMNMMYEKKYFSEKQLAPGKREAESAFTYEKLGQLFTNMKIKDKKLLSFVKNNKRSKAIYSEEWAEILELLAEKQPDHPAEIEEFNVVATTSNVSSVDPWTVVTTVGNYKFTGLAMDYYIDKRIEVLSKGDEILCVRKITSRSVAYPNSLALSIENGQIQAFINGVVRAFDIGEKDLSQTNVIADIHVKNGKVSSYNIKKEFVTGKLLRYTDDSLEIEGRGSFPIGEGFRVYKTYGDIEADTLYDLVVGYDVQRFVIENGTVCAVLIDRNFVADNIRVIIKTNGFEDIYHESVLVSSDKEFEFTYGGETKKFLAGEEFTITGDSPYLSSGSLKISTAGIDSKITVKSLQRGYGEPAYRGTLEVVKTEEGLLLINELPLEQYLYAVVPSEMPYTYQEEALKAQAICARSYAYKQMKSNSYANLGAHVDDSTSFQVYNNSMEQETTSKAVDDTYGQIMTYDGETISAFFYSTSCGSSTDADIWGGSGYPYIKGKLLVNEEQSIDLQDEAQFRMFITNAYDTYDKEYGWYRWNVAVPLGNLTNGVNAMLASLYESGPEKVLTKVGNDYVSQPISTVGNVQSVETGTRGAGGVLNYVVIHGDEAVVMVKTESFIRKIFNPAGCVITKQDGSTVDTFSSLPSSFFVIDEVREGDTLVGYRFLGGGYGHGAGMSQNGANSMGVQGMDYQEILKFFYDGVEIVGVY